MWVDSLLRRLSPAVVVLLGVLAALVSLALLGLRDATRVDSFNHKITWHCQGVFPDILHSTARVPRPDSPRLVTAAAIDRERRQQCAVAARDRLAGVLLMSAGIGIATMVVLAGFARTTAKRSAATVERSAATFESPTIADQLERLARLHLAGDLTDEEFAAAKRSLVSQ